MTREPPRKSTVGATRLLLSRIRDIMAGSGTAQERLDKLVDIIATGMVAEVCSVYLLRAGEVLELFATEGLKSSAVHVTRLRLGEGLIGDIAAHATPLVLSDATAHPQFVYRPETGEEVYNAFLGVPILREGRVIGVLTVQNKAMRHYTDDELDAMQTIAMVLAELVASGELVDRSEILPAVDGIGLLPLRLEGTRLNAGVARGVAVLHEPRITVRAIVADDIGKEVERLRVAVEEMHGALDALLRMDLMADGEQRDVLETYRMIAADAGWLSRIEEAIRTGLTAEAAVQRVQEETSLHMSQIADPYLRDRAQDLDDLANRLLQHLTGEHRNGTADLPERAVLIARTMGPAELLDYDAERLAGVVLEQGSPNSHVAIIARAMDIPVLGRVKNLFEQVTDLDQVVVDADNDQVFIRPGDDIVEAFDETIKAREDQKLVYAALRDVPADTVDGVHIELQLNAGLLADLSHLDDTGAEGVGLYRTEIPFMSRPELPNVSEQVRLYRRILDQAGDRPVTFRTLDAGGDKVLPYWTRSEEENPAMGWRAIRLTLDRPAILRQQLRALITAGAGRHLRIMFPMVAEVPEFLRARELLELEAARHLARGGLPPRKLEAGAMLEVPSLLFQMPALLDAVDFLSIGTNDLIQFLFAADRGSHIMSRRYDVLSPTVLVALKEVVDRCRDAGVPVSSCGEIGGRPLEAMAMIGIGLRQLSMPATTIGPVKAMIRNLICSEIEETMDRVLGENKHSFREDLRNFALDHDIPI